MPRSIRIEFEGAFYHVMARGNRREAIFLDDEDRRFFLKTLSDACKMTGWQIHAWVLMGNHYHILLETPEPNLVSGMQWLQNAYTRRFNTRHRLWGRLFGDRYKAVPVEGIGYYYETLLDYIHLNPARAGLVDPQASLLDYPWSSVADGYALEPGRRAKWLAAASGLKAFGCEDTAAGRRLWVERLDKRAREEAGEECGVPQVQEGRDARLSNLRRGWYWGSQAFPEQLMKIGEAVLGKKRNRAYDASEELRAHGESVARQLLDEGLLAAGLATEDLAGLPGSDPRKVAIASVIWHRTTVKMTWIANALWMRSEANASQQIRRLRLAPKPLPQPLQKWIELSPDVT